MKKIKQFFRLFVVGFISFFIHGKAKAASKTSRDNIEKRITDIRKNINQQLKDKAAKDITIDFKNYTYNNDWANWGNWGNWNNWNNWVKWNDWNNWNNWHDFSNWQKFSNY